ncbi:MAG TPA: helix-turn-helix transcriptional regulator [Thermoanaerobaculia bacterium]|nr:helix-turn-helix transcriptional regulator [Thermoanaerobaculia bacterium]
MSPSNEPLRSTVTAYVEECFARETSPRVSELAQRLGISRANLTSRFEAELRESPSSCLKRMQFERAMFLMRTTSLSLTRIAYMCGFGTRRTFFRAFQRAYGCSPGSVRTSEYAELAD